MLFSIAYILRLGCHTSHFSLDKRYRYYPYPWGKHRKKCQNIKAAEVCSLQVQVRTLIKRYQWFLCRFFRKKGSEEFLSPLLLKTVCHWQQYVPTRRIVSSRNRMPSDHVQVNLYVYFYVSQSFLALQNIAPLRSLGRVATKRLKESHEWNTKTERCTRVNR